VSSYLPENNPAEAGFSFLANGSFWPIAEIVDAEIQAHLGSAFEWKAAICLPGVIISASDPKEPQSFCQISALILPLLVFTQQAS
jgi:hypothetical protein